jgi:hypothetical protein
MSSITNGATSIDVAPFAHLPGTFTTAAARMRTDRFLSGTGAGILPPMNPSNESDA